MTEDISSDALKYRDAEPGDSHAMIEVSDDGQCWLPSFYIGRSLSGKFVTQGRFSIDLKISEMSRVLCES